MEYNISLLKRGMDITFSAKQGEILKVYLSCGGDWLGYGSSPTQHYPLNSGVIENESYAVSNVQSPMLISSIGYLIIIDTFSVLYFKLDGPKSELTLSSKDSTFKVIFANCGDYVSALRCARKFFGVVRPTTSPYFGSGFYCTWTEMPRCINQVSVINYAKKIKQDGYPVGVLILDDKWESSYGDLSFSSDFPKPREMIEELHALGFKVWLWTTPFVSCGSDTYKSQVEKNYLIRNKDCETAKLVWWGGNAGIVDLSNKKAKADLISRLNALKIMGVDGFKIDGGDARFIPVDSEGACRIEKSRYIEELLSVYSEISPYECESRTAWRSQSKKIIWREGGKDSNFSDRNGLKALVRLGIEFGALGYDVFIPDMVGGRIRTMREDAPLPSDRLFVRFMEASVFFPIIQLSYLPLHYGKVIDEICKSYYLLHTSLETLLVNYLSSSDLPPVMPVLCGGKIVVDEYYYCGDLLVAPILDEGERRIVVFPEGEWIDVRSGKVYSAQEIDYYAPCPCIPVFARKDTSSMDVLMHASMPKSGTVGEGTSATYGLGINRIKSTTA